MLEKFIYFSAGFLLARYLILRDGIETYKAKEAELISTGKEKIDTIVGKSNFVNVNDNIDDDEYYPVEESVYASPFGTY